MNAATPAPKHRLASLGCISAAFVKAASASPNRRGSIAAVPARASALASSAARTCATPAKAANKSVMHARELRMAGALTSLQEKRPERIGQLCGLFRRRRDFVASPAYKSHSLRSRERRPVATDPVPGCPRDRPRFSALVPPGAYRLTVYMLTSRLSTYGRQDQRRSLRQPRPDHPEDARRAW